MSDDTTDDTTGDTTDDTTDDTATGDEAVTRPAAAAKTPSPGRRPTPAASAASRARRIGGATGSTGATGSSTGSTGSKATKTAETGPAGTVTEPVSVRKSAGRSSARDLKDEAARTTGPRVVTEVPAWLRWVPAAVLSVCAIAMIVIVAVSSHGVWWAKTSSTGQRDKVLAAAKQCTAYANTYGYTTLAADEKRGLSCTTGDWTSQYKSAMDKIVKPTATKLKATQTVKINAAGIESGTAKGAQFTVVIYGQLTINQTGQTPRIDPFSAVVRMDHVKSRYLVSKIDLITNPNG